jgi:hypothetical protein
MALMYHAQKERFILSTGYKFDGVNRKMLDKRMAAFTCNGTDPSSDVIVSLTSFPARITDVHYAVYSLLTQTLRPRKVVLWLAEEQFPDKNRGLPHELLRLMENGLEILWTHNLRAYTKLVPALRAYGDAVIVTADDDVFYRKDWLSLLYMDYCRHNREKMVYAHRAHRVRLLAEGGLCPYKQWRQMEGAEYEPSFFNFATGCMGVLYPPGVLHGDVLNEDLFMRLAPMADDVFYWAMAICNNTKIKVVPDNQPVMIAVNIEREAGMNGDYTLHSENVDAGKNDEQLANVLEYYPQVLQQLKNEAAATS